MDATTMEQQAQDAVSGAIASGADDVATDAPQPQTDTAGTNGQQEAPAPDGAGVGEGASGDSLIPRSVMEAQLENERRHWQSVIDRRFSEYEKKFASVPAQTVQPQPTEQPPAPQDAFDNEKFMELLDDDPAKARAYFFSHNSPNQNPADIQQAVSQAVQQALTQQQQHEQQMAQFVDSMNAATDGLTEQEKERANQYAVQNYQQTGQFADPYMAAMVGRYGSVQEALRMANAQMSAMSQTQPPPQPQQQPPVQSGPGLVGGGIGQTPKPAGESPGDSQIKPGMFRSLLR